MCVFAGATSGIGASTLSKLIVMLDSPTFYIIGRSNTRFASQQAKLENLNPSCKLVFLKAEVSLLTDIDAVCKQIIGAEKKVDILFMSCGLLPFNGPTCLFSFLLKWLEALKLGIDTKEGLETCFTLSYYSRMRLTSNLLPLLRQSPTPRVLSVLNAGKEAAMRDDDIGLEQNCDAFGIMKHTVTMTSLAFEYLAENEKGITFLHSGPGWVNTTIFTKLTPPESSGLAWTVLLAVIRTIAAVSYSFVGLTVEECGERQAFYLSSDAFTPGAWRVDGSSEKISPGCVLVKYREGGWPEKV